MHEDIPLLLRQRAKEAGLDIEPAARELLLKYLRILREHNRNINLIGTTSAGEIIRKHIIDSLYAAPFIADEPGIKAADIGSGAGLPGIALQIARPSLSMTLIESSAKKCSFLKTALSDLGLAGAAVVCARAETLGKDFSCREGYNLVVCRAVSHLAVIAEYALPLLSEGGVFIAYKGPKAGREIEESGEAITMLGGRIAGIHEKSLPGQGEKRLLVFIEKSGRTPAAYPRKPGVPVKRPLIKFHVEQSGEET